MKENQTVLTIRQRKQDFVNRYNELLSSELDIQHNMYFRHVCAVLNHAEEIFKYDVDTLVRDIDNCWRQMRKVKD